MLTDRVSDLSELAAKYRSFWINEHRVATLLGRGEVPSFSQARYETSSPPHPTIADDSVTEPETEPEDENIPEAS